MNRRNFGKMLGLVSSAAIVSPKVLAEIHYNPEYKKIFDEKDWEFYEDFGYSPELIRALERMYIGKMRIYNIVRSSIKDIHQAVPTIVDGRFKPCNHGDFKVYGFVGRINEEWFHSLGVPADFNVDASDIGYAVQFRQLVNNVKHGSIGFLKCAPSIYPQRDDASGMLCEGMISEHESDSNIERLCRESFLGLQKSVVDWHYNGNISGGAEGQFYLEWMDK